MKTTLEPMLEVYADVNFVGNWNKVTFKHDVSTAKSRTGFLITFAKCPIMWTSKLQTQIALSTKEAEYITLSISLRKEIHIMDLIKKLRLKNIIENPKHAKVYCKCFEVNSGAFCNYTKNETKSKACKYHLTSCQRRRAERNN